MLHDWWLCFWAKKEREINTVSISSHKLISIYYEATDLYSWTLAGCVLSRMLRVLNDFEKIIVRKWRVHQNVAKGEADARRALEWHFLYTLLVSGSFLLYQVEYTSPKTKTYKTGLDECVLFWVLCVLENVENKIF